MKNIILPLSLALTLSCGAALAQQAPDQAAPQQSPTAQGYPHHHHPRDPHRQAEFIGQKLSLNADQTARIEPVLAARDQQMRDLWQNQQINPQDRHQQMRAINEQAQQGMASILSPEQMTQLKELRRYQHHRRFEHGENPQAPGL